MAHARACWRYVCIKNIQFRQCVLYPAVGEGLHGLSTVCSTGNVSNCGVAIQSARIGGCIGITGVNILFYDRFYSQGTVLAKK